MDIQQVYVDEMIDRMKLTADAGLMDALMMDLMRPVAIYWKRRKGDTWLVAFSSHNADDHSKVGYPKFSTREFLTQEAMRVELTRIKMLVNDVKTKEKRND